MPSETLQAVVIRHANYREHDRMLTLLTPDHGRVDVLARGCRRPKSPLMTASELFVHGEFVVFRGGERFTLTGCTVTDTFYPLRLDPYRLTCGTYMLGLMQAAAQPEQPAHGLYALLLKGLYHITYCGDEAALAIVNTFLLLYAAELGYRPRLNHCARCREPLASDTPTWLDGEAGGLCCAKCAQASHYPISAAQTAWMRDALRSGFGAPLVEGDATLFTALRRYVEGRLESSIKAGQLLP
jgi:DNA repair protein RecO (recombination protein O)